MMEQDTQLPPPPPAFPAPSSLSKRKAPMSSSRPPPPRPIHTPTSPMASTIPHNLLPSAPASPPTPAPSPTPLGRAPDWSTAAEHEDANVRHVRSVFVEMNDAEKQRLLAELLNLCSSQQLAFVQDFVSPRLKKDPFMTFPDSSKTHSSQVILKCKRNIFYPGFKDKRGRIKSHEPPI